MVPENWIVIASGPSMAKINMAAVKASGWRVLTVNNSWEIAPWATAMYAGDYEWWQDYGDKARAFTGQKWTRSGRASRQYGAHRVIRDDMPGLNTSPGRVNSGGNSGYQAVNLAYHFGARQIILLGFDMHRQNGAHWHGDHPPGLLNAPDRHIRKWRQNFQQLAADLSREDVKVVNATPGTALTCFPRTSLKTALQFFGEKNENPNRRKVQPLRPQANRRPAKLDQDRP